MANDEAESISRFTAGDAVQTPLGKGVVREVRNNGRLSIEVNGRSVVLEESAVAPLTARKTSGGKRNRRERLSPRQAFPPLAHEARPPKSICMASLSKRRSAAPNRQ